MFDFETFLHYNFAMKDEFGELVKELKEWRKSSEIMKSLEKSLDEFRFYRGIVVSLIIGILGTLLLSFKVLEGVLICGGIGIVIILIFILIPLTLKINGIIREIKGG